jgi:hypothetical protein
MADIKRSNTGGRVKQMTESSKRFISLPNNNTVTREMIQDQAINDDKLIAKHKQILTVQSGDYTIQTEDGLNIIFFDDTSVDRICNLPVAADNLNRIIEIKNTSTDQGMVTITPNGVETIDDLASVTLDCKGARIKLLSDGSNWQVLDVFFTDKVYDRSGVGEITDTNWTTNFAELKPTRNLEGQWFCIFWFGGIYSSAVTNSNIRIHEIKCLDTQAITHTASLGTGNLQRSQAANAGVNNRTQLTLIQSIAATNWAVSGNIVLIEKPTFVE